MAGRESGDLIGFTHAIQTVGTKHRDLTATTTITYYYTTTYYYNYYWATLMLATHRAPWGAEEFSRDGD